MQKKIFYNLFRLDWNRLRQRGRLFLLTGCICTVLQHVPSFAETGPSTFSSVVPERMVTNQGQEPLWKNRWDAARDLVRAGKPDEAIAVYDEVLRLKPELEDASWELVQLLLKLGKRSRALSLLETLHENDPGRRQYSLAFATLLEQEGKLARAKSFLEQLLSKEGDTPEVLFALIAILRQGDDKEQLLDLVQRYQLLQPGDRKIRLLLAKTAFALNRLELARKNITPLAEDAGADPEILRLAAEVHQRLGLINPAVHYWREVAGKIPRDKEANTVLAEYYAKQPGKEQTALSYFLAIKDFKPLPDEYGFEVGSLYAAMGRWSEAIAYLEDFSHTHPDSKKGLRLLINAHAAVGDKKKTLALLEQYFALEKSPDPGKIRQAADLYDAAGRYHQAIPLYRELLELTPDDPELLEVLARDLLAIGEDEGSLEMWQLLSRTSPQRLDVHSSMAALLEKLGRNEELVKVLLRMQAMAPGDVSVSIRLAEAYRRLDDRKNCAKVLSGLLSRVFVDSDWFARRASLCQYLGWYEHALNDYLKLLKADSGSRAEADLQKVRLAALRCAGKTGQIRVLAKLSEDIGDRSLSDRLVLARAYRDAGALWQAENFFRQLLASASGKELPAALSDEQRQEVIKNLAALYGEQQRLYEQQEMLRLLALENGSEKVAIAALAEVAASNGQPEVADGWLSRLMPKWRQKKIEFLPSGDFRLYAAEIKAKCAILLAEKREKEARESVETLRETLQSQQKRGKDGRNRRFVLLTDLAWLFSEAGQYRESGALALAASHYQATQRQKIVLTVIGAKEAQMDGTPTEMQRYLHDAAAMSEDDGSLRLFYVRTLQRAKMFDQAAEPAARLPDLLPDSLAAHLVAARNLRAAGRYEEALQEAERTAETFSGCSEPRWLAMQLLYRQGRFDQALSIYRGFDGELQQRPDVLLLMARSLWSSGRHQEAIAVFRSFLEPAAEQQYLAEGAASRAPQAAAGQHSRRNKLFSLLGRKEPSLLERRLSPEAFDRGDMAVVSLTAKFLWQQQYRQELAARNSVERFEFYHAARLYKSILEKEQTPDLAMLFDLAGIYSRLERPGEEAAIYERIAAMVPDYPGLDAAMAQNSLKRRPRAGLYYTFKREEGRDDKKSIERQAGGLSSWIALAARQEIALQVERIDYRSTLADGGPGQWGKRLKATYNTSILQGLSASLGAGVERLDDNGSNMPLFDGRLDGEMGDAFSWYLSYGIDITDDTLESLRQRIRRQSYSLGSSMDLHPRLQIGADYLVDSFSDGNLTEGYDFWTRYLLFTEPNVLALRYKYEFKDSKDSSYPDIFLEGGSKSTEHPYYTPHNYWLNNFGLYFKHQLSPEKFGRGIPGYYEVSLSLGHDSSGYAVQTLQAGFFSQLSSHLLLRASADITTSQPYRSKDASLSIQYRW